MKKNQKEKKQLKFGLIIPAKDISFIELAINSAYAQTYLDWHLYIHFNGCDKKQLDAILEKIKDEPRITYFISDEALGCYKPINLMWDAMDEDYAIQYGSDDVLPVDFLERYADFLTANPDIDFSYVDLYCINHEGKQIGEREVPEIDGTAQQKLACIQCQLLPSPGQCVAKHIYKNDQYNEKWPISSDHDFAIRMVLFYNPQKCPDNFIYYRIHDKQVSETHTAMQKKYDKEIIEHWKEQVKTGKVKL